MRIRLSVAIVVGLLFCTLAALELPELISLTDDTSNDFSLLDTQQETLVVVSDFHLRQPVSSPLGMSPSSSDRKHPNGPAPVFSSVRTAKESLHLLCTLRT
jgi:hypothetical protein